MLAAQASRPFRKRGAPRNTAPPETRWPTALEAKRMRGRGTRYYPISMALPPTA